MILESQAGDLTTSVLLAVADNRGRGLSGRDSVAKGTVGVVIPGLRDDKQPRGEDESNGKFDVSGTLVLADGSPRSPRSPGSPQVRITDTAPGQMPC